jgi:LPS export ABC transporter permease LptG/LPS export ABC transporter permease LptF
VRIITRYILREVVSHALLGGMLFTFLLFMRDLGQILDLVVRDSAPLTSVAAVFIYSLPNVLTITIPMAMLVGVLLGLSRMAADSEITAMRAAGIGVMTFVRVLAMVGVTACAISLFNTLWLAPHATEALLHLENNLKSSQASFEVQPRVFYEDFHNYVLYVQDIRAGAHAVRWRKVFLADLSSPEGPRITTAAEATVINAGSDTVQMQLRNGAEHDTVDGDPSQYSISTFQQSEIPIQFHSQSEFRMGRADAPILAMPSVEVWRAARARGGDKLYAIEFQKRLSYPFACIVLMLVGVPLGMSSRRGGKGAGFVLTIALVFVYYFLSSTGIALARQGKVAPWLGVWAANLVFAFAGAVLLRQLTRGMLTLGPLASFLRSLRKHPDAYLEGHAARPLATRSHRFPLILDAYVLRSFFANLVIVLLAFVMLLLVFTFFDLLGDIIRNRIALTTVGLYLLDLMPSMIYVSTPLAVLIAVLSTFGLLNRSSELTAMKATGISLYRVIAPVLVIAALLAVALFAFDDFYVPLANRKQEALRMTIKGKPAQTYLRPDRKWIFGQAKPGEPGRIYYYRFFDTAQDHDQFADLTVFEFDPNTFLLTRRIFAKNVEWQPRLNEWLFEDGWTRTFRGDEVQSYAAFDVATFPELGEPPRYFKKEVRQSQEMNFAELGRYIRDLQQSGFDVVRLRVALFHKFAYPVIALVMAVLAVPFALSMGKRGSLTGIATAVAIAIVYWVIANLFESMGNASMLPPALAAWSPDILFALAAGYLLLRAPT